MAEPEVQLRRERWNQWTLEWQQLASAVMGAARRREVQEWEEEWAKEEEYFSESSQTIEEATEGRRFLRRRNKP